MKKFTSIFFIVTSFIFAATHYVSLTGGNVPPYTSWATAANNIQDAVNVAVSNDVVLVADGIYSEGGAATPHYGGFNRVMINKPIIVKSANGPDKTVIVGKTAGDSGAVRCAYLTNNAVLTGFTLKDGISDSMGGGVCLDHGSVISNCVITECKRRGVYLYWGGLVSDCKIISNGFGGAYIYRGGIISNTLISGNYDTNKYGKGAGVYVGMDGIIDHCEILNNILSGERSEGGGVYFSQEPTYTGWAVLRFSKICGNSADREAGGVRITGNEYTWVLVDNCVICSNKVNDSGGGATFWYGGRMNDCLVFGNNAMYGGGMYFFADSLHPSQHGEVRNCTIVNNNAWFHGGGIDNDGPSYVYNSIIYYNDAPDATNYDVYTTFRYCCSEPAADGTGNTGDVPLFQDIYSADYHLLKMSPCINAGNNSYTNGVETTDLEGLPRVMGGTVNMGCYEQNRDPDISPPTINLQTSSSGFSAPVKQQTNTLIYGTKSIGRFVVSENIFGGWVTNDIFQELNGSVWTNYAVAEVGVSNEFFYRQMSADQNYVSTGYVSKTVFIVPEPCAFFALLLLFFIKLKK